LVQWILFKWRLAKLERDRAAVLKAHQKAIKKAKADEENIQLIQGLHQDQYFEITMLDSTRASLVTRRLLSIAYALMLPTPQDDYWERCEVTGYRVLTDEGIHLLRRSIREERKSRREAALAWLAAITGVVGALTGLIAVAIGQLF